MGRAMVEEFCAEGARVAALDIDREAAEATVAGLDAGARALAVGVDVSDPESVRLGVEEVLGWAGRVDVLCNNAGILDSYLPAHEVSVEEWDRVIGVNQTGPFLMSRAVIPDMLSRGAGVIINTASVSAFSAAGGGTAYTSSKHGVLGLTRQLTFDYGSKGIRVNAICPGATLTGMTGADGGEQAVEMDPEIARTPAGRWCQPAEIARLAVFLAGSGADFMHGSAVVFDGGWLTAARNPF
ncbi:MAG: SDR family oxidoreductase [Actinobacteria bacterium]|nr:SDR family oxidoreductase [Actinomycetota bacterium]